MPASALIVSDSFHGYYLISAGGFGAIHGNELRPGRPGAPASVTFRLPGDHVVGRHRAWLDPVTATPLRVDRHDQLAPGQRLLGNMGPWHFGTFGGPVTRFLWFVAGLVPTVLFATGAWLWARRRRT